MQNRTVMLGLGYAGLLPFYGFLAGAWLLSDWPGAVSVQGFVIYSLGILCFLGGTLWGRVQTVEEPVAEEYRLPRPRVAREQRRHAVADEHVDEVAVLHGVDRLHVDVGELRLLGHGIRADRVHPLAPRRRRRDEDVVEGRDATLPLSEVVANWDELAEALGGSVFEDMLA